MNITVKNPNLIEFELKVTYNLTQWKLLQTALKNSSGGAHVAQDFLDAIHSMIHQAQTVFEPQEKQ